MLFLLCKLSNVTKFSKAAVHIKKATLTGTLTFQMFFQGKYWASGGFTFPTLWASYYHKCWFQAVVHVKKATLTRTLTFQMLFRGKDCTSGGFIFRSLWASYYHKCWFQALICKESYLNRNFILPNAFP